MEPTRVGSDTNLLARARVLGRAVTFGNSGRNQRNRLYTCRRWFYRYPGCLRHIITSFLKTFLKFTLEDSDCMFGFC